MKRLLLLLFACILVCKPLSAKEAGSDCCRTDAVCDGIRSATVLSMMGWGVGLAVGIALLTGLLDQDTGGGHAQ
jgi:hypothetical protein